jgi:hypothetical protein
MQSLEQTQQEFNKLIIYDYDTHKYVVTTLPVTRFESNLSSIGTCYIFTPVEEEAERSNKSYIRHKDKLYERVPYIVERVFIDKEKKACKDYLRPLSQDDHLLD